MLINNKIYQIKPDQNCYICFNKQVPMKNIIVLTLLLVGIKSTAQLNINVGNDTIVCANSFSNTIFSTTITGGSLPFTYSWTTNTSIQIGSLTYDLKASDYLNDTTISSPTLINIASYPIEFILNVIDNNGLTDSDTLIVSFSYFTTHLGSWSHNLLNGDSLYINNGPNVSGGIPPTTFLWQPNHGLTDSTSEVLSWIKPTESTNYKVTVTDSIGCTQTGGSFIFVYVGFANINDVLKNNEITIFPNPSDGTLNLNTANFNNLTKISLHNSSGVLVKNHNLNETQLDLSSYPKGIYILKFETTTDTFYKRIILK